MISFPTETGVGSGHLALPASGAGPGVLVLHAWWGLNPFFKDLADRLAAEGFVALAPDLNGGKVAATIEEAEALMQQRDTERSAQALLGAHAALAAHPAVRGGRVGLVGFSAGSAWGGWLSEVRPESVAAAVLFYGASDADFGAARAAYLCHLAENDPYEEPEYLAAMEAGMRAAGRAVTTHTYPGTQHWFFERDRPEYSAAAADLALERTLAFLRAQLGDA